jgi:hypothetical protein
MLRGKKLVNRLSAFLKTWVMSPRIRGPVSGRALAGVEWHPRCQRERPTSSRQVGPAGGTPRRRRIEWRDPALSAKRGSWSASISNPQVRCGRRSGRSLHDGDPTPRGSRPGRRGNAVVVRQRSRRHCSFSFFRARRGPTFGQAARNCASLSKLTSSGDAPPFGGRLGDPAPGT